MVSQNTNNRIKVLIVEDSPTVSMYLEYLLESDPDIEVVGNVSNGKLAVEFVMKNKPDVVTMDIDMPVMNGYDATREIMSTNPVPIIIVTASRNAKKQNTSMDALSAGALTVIQKPTDIKLGLDAEPNRRLVSMVKIYSQVKVIRRRFSQKKEPVERKLLDIRKSKEPKVSTLQARKYIAIGVSTGGPEILKKILDGTPGNLKLPIVVVQHITEGFLEGMVNWLDKSSKLIVKVANNGEQLLPGHVYFAPNRFQMGINRNKIFLQKGDSGIKICPSVEFLFSSLLKEDPSGTVAMLLTGMGSDGANELKLLKDAGALTIAQDKESSLVFGMPKKAIDLNGARYILHPDQIVKLLKNLEGEEQDPK